MHLILATHNPHKVGELGILLGAAFQVEGLEGFDASPVWEETGSTFEENAAIKARVVSKACPYYVLADDSGLEVDALQGRPGVYSARYAGENADDAANCQKVLDELRQPALSATLRTARFRCVLAVARAGEILGTFEGAVEGTLAAAPSGTGGFGYDPVFVPEGFDQTFAELGGDVKNRLSHRARAVREALPFLNSLAEEQEGQATP